MSAKKRIPPQFQRNTNGNNNQGWIVGILLASIIVFTIFFNRNNALVEIGQTDFEQMLIKREITDIAIVNDETVEVTLKPEAIASYKHLLPDGGVNLPSLKTPQFKFRVISAEAFKKDLDELQKSFDRKDIIHPKPERRVGPFEWISSYGLIILMLISFYFLFFRAGAAGGMGGGIFNIGRSKAALFEGESQVKITFNDVAGLDEAKEEVQEVVEFLKTPTKFTDLGGKIPKGVLLVGPPGTGKTLLAKAVAGEANVPFFSLSGSDFVEMFVGVGAARVRDLFRQAREKAPSIIFIDEIDAVGRSRNRNSAFGGNDERENTLNSLLVEMDGFPTDKAIIIMAATNRPDVLDPALLRPGRFDRQISIDKPDVIGREAIFKVHLKPLKMSPKVDAKELATQTPGFAGAEIANVCNEAALIAARRNKKEVDPSDFQEAMDRVIGGLEKKNKLISPDEKQIVAYHEAGHAVTGWFLEHTEPLVKVSIVPRGIAALGYAQYLPKEQFLYRTEQLFEEMCMTLGGRVAEDIVFGKVSTGALSDLERITKLATSMVTVYGMNATIGNVSYYDSKQSEYNFNRPYSEQTAREIDEEVRKHIAQAYERTKILLTEKREALEIIAQELLKKEVIYQNDLERLIGKRPFEGLTTYQAFTKREEEVPTETEETKKES